jgi:peptidoglycan/xylan/chitin deacetylase (PgdA/CDA1 family)
LRRRAIERFARRDFCLDGDVSYVSFTFDDFPSSALTEGGRILGNSGVRGTYFVSLQLLECDSPSGRIASWADLESLVSEGHELGCHTFGHLDGSKVSAAEFERSIEANSQALATSAIDAKFQVFAYPLNGPAVETKRIAGERFLACRGGGQCFNRDTVDLSLLKAYFLDHRSGQNLAEVRQLIEANAAAKGWLIFATHDVAENPSPYGCPPAFFDEIVRLSLMSGAKVMPMSHVCQQLGIVD